jgi:hypothetical protein
VGNVVSFARDAGQRVAASVGDIDENMDATNRSGFTTVSLTEMFGSDNAHQNVLRCIEEAALSLLK